MSSSSGLESLVGYRDESPIGALCFALGDPNASSHAVLAVLAALRRVRATGKGCYIDLAQIEALAGVLRPYIIDSQIRDRQTPTFGNAHPDFAPHGIFPAAEHDAWLTIAITCNEQWQAFADIASAESWTSSSQYEDNTTRLTHVEQLNADIASWTVQHPRDGLVKALRNAGIASSPVLSVEEQWEDPHFRTRNIKQAVNIPIYGEEELFQAPWRFSDFTPKITKPGPTTGQHNRHVFSQLLGLSDEEIDELERAGVIA